MMAQKASPNEREETISRRKIRANSAIPTSRPARNRYSDNQVFRDIRSIEWRSIPKPRSIQSEVANIPVSPHAPTTATNIQIDTSRSVWTTVLWVMLHST